MLKLKLSFSETVRIMFASHVVYVLIETHNLSNWSNANAL